MHRHSVHDYPSDWFEIAERVKAEAGWKCIRCGLMMYAMCPIIFDMAGPAESDEIAKRVGFPVTLQSEFAKWNDVGNGQLFWKITAVLSAVLASMAVAVTCLIALLAPVWSIVGKFAALPMGAALSAKMIGEPLQTAPITTKSFGRARRRNRSFFSAGLASIGDTMRFAGNGTIATLFGVRLADKKGFSTSFANAFNLSILGAAIRAINLLSDYRWFSREGLTALLTNPSEIRILAGQRTEFTSARFRWIFMKLFSTSGAMNSNLHVGIIPYVLGAMQ